MEQGGHDELLARTDATGVNRVLLRVVRMLFVPFFRIYFRLGRVGREHVPKTGPVIFAANHRSFLDPFVIGTLVSRPIYFVAKKELFEKSRIQRWFLNGLGAFPIDRGSGDDAAMNVARRILERGDCVMIFPEGTRVRPGPLGRPRRGVGRLALEAGAVVVPVAVHGTDNVRRGWRIYPRRVTVRAGAPLTFPTVEKPSAALAKAVTDRVWPCVEMQWEWLGGTTPVRRVAIVGAGSWGTSLAVALGRSGVEVELGCRTAEQSQLVERKRLNDRYLPGVALPQPVRVVSAADLDLASADLVCLAVPTRAIPAAIAQIADRLGPATGLLVLSKGLVAPGGELPATYCAARAGGRTVACLGGPSHAADALEHGAALVVACADREQTARLRALFADAGFDVETTTDVEGVDLAGVAKNAAVLAAATASVLGPNAAGAAAGKVFSEVAAYAGAIGGRPETWTGLAGAGDLVASVVAAGGRNRRAGEMLARGVEAADVSAAIGQVAESLDTLPLLVTALEQRGVRAPATRALAEVVEGRGSALAFAEQVTAPRRIVGTRVA